MIEESLPELWRKNKGKKKRGEEGKKKEKERDMIIVIEN